jgi:CheY-like chemotaxis protein
MSEKAISIMLVDDNPDDNFFHEREIKRNNPNNSVIKMNSGAKALDYLKSIENEGSRPDLILLDINMPGMNGWEFLEEYSRLEKEVKLRSIIIILTTSENPDDVARAKGWVSVSDYRSKPLTGEIMADIIGKYFKDAP